MKSLAKTAVLLTAVLFAFLSHAEPARGDDSAVFPFLSEGTFLVGRLDIDKVDRDAFGAYMAQAFNSMLGQIPEQARGQVQQQMNLQVEKAKKWLSDMSEAGGKRIYLVLDSADMQSGPVMVVPTGAGVDAERVKGLFSTLAGPSTSAQEVGKAIVVGNSASVDHVKQRVDANAAPAESPNLPLAFTAAGNAPLRIALVPGEAGRKWIEENLPQLPEALGGGQTTLLSRGVRYASVAINQKPSTVASVAVQCEDAEKAKGLLDSVTRGIESLKAKVAGTPLADDLTKKIDALKPTLVGDILILDVDPIAVQMLGAGVFSSRAAVAQ